MYATKKRRSEIPCNLNISKQSKLNQMLGKLNFINGPLLGELRHSSLSKNHELLDYILVKTKQFTMTQIEHLS